jgi:ubiquitin-protein ligase
MFDHVIDAATAKHLASLREKRVGRELEECKRCFSIKLVNNDLFIWEATVATVEDGRVSSLRIEFPEAYPFHAPVLRFATHAFPHPKVKRDGVLRLEVLQDSWSPSIRMVDLLGGDFSLRTLLNDQSFAKSTSCVSLRTLTSTLASWATNVGIAPSHMHGKACGERARLVRYAKIATR